MEAVPDNNRLPMETLQVSANNVTIEAGDEARGIEHGDGTFDEEPAVKPEARVRDECNITSGTLKHGEGGRDNHDSPVRGGHNGTHELPAHGDAVCQPSEVFSRVWLQIKKWTRNFGQG